MRTVYTFLSSLFLVCTAHTQQLVINEISQGTAVKEYVEFLVSGNPTCQTPVPTLDLRGIIIDDNNGDFAAGSGTGIAVGAVRFANVSFWSAIPQGTLILVYNESDINPAVPPIDASMTDGNCRLILPINSNLFEGQAISPTSGTSAYPNAVSWIVGGGTWSQVAMSNTNDSFQIRQTISSPTSSHVVSWGNNTLNNQIYFTTASSAVFSMVNSTSNNPSSQSNWVSGAVGANETPGSPNNTANDTWIGAMNPQCGLSNSIQLNLSSVATGCGATCSGTASVSISGGTPPYTILWSNGASSSTISNLCAASYTVTVTDNGGCNFTDQVIVNNSTNSIVVQLTPTDESCLGNCNGTIVPTVTGSIGTLTYAWSNGGTTNTLSNLCPNSYSLTVTDQTGCSGTANTVVIAGNPIPDATITAAGPFTTDNSPYTFQAASSGGTWSSDCVNCLNATTGVFNPQTAGEGIFEICYSNGTGTCVDNDCISVTVTQGCTTIQNSASVTLCPGLTYNYNGNTLSTAGNYPQTYTAQNGCDSIFTLQLSYFPQTVEDFTQYLCLGDSVEVNGSWISQADIIYTPMTDANGCSFIQKLTVLTEDCTIEDLLVFAPNAFTPNGDGTNDLFQVFITGGVFIDGFILNRWGNTVKELNAEELSWDGKFDGEIVQDGVYTFVIRVRKKENDYVELVTGFVTVFR